MPFKRFQTALLANTFVFLSINFAFAQTTPITTFSGLDTALGSDSDENSPVVIGANIVFANQIVLNNNTYIEDNNYIFDGATTYTSDGKIATVGSGGFQMTSGNHTFNNVDMKNFSFNYYGAAINNKSLDFSSVSDLVTTINGSSFSNNYTYFTPSILEPFYYGGAVDNFYATMNINDSEFYNNRSGGGGALSNSGGDLTIKNTTFYKNIAQKPNTIWIEGGAIANYGNMWVYDSLFEENNATTSQEHDARGGAVFNGNGSITHIYNSTFSKNTADDKGGAIFAAEDSITSIYNSTLTDNSTMQNGGAIYIDGKGEVHVYNSTFEKNTASDFGGAIFNDWHLYIYAKDGTTLFENNKANGISNAIHNTCYVELLANSNGNIIFNDSITSIDDSGGFLASTMNIGKEGYDGTILLNADMSGALGNTNLLSGTIAIGNDMGVDANGYLNMFGGGLNVNIVANGKSFINLQNSNFDNFFAGTLASGKNGLTLSTDLYANIDINLQTKQADKFINLQEAGGSNNVVLNSINIINPIAANNIVVEVAENSGDRITLSDSLKTVQTPLYKYSIDDTNLASDGTLIFDGGNTGGFHPAVLTSSSAKKTHTTVLSDITKHVLTPNNIQTNITNLSSGDNLKKPMSFWMDVKGLSEDIKLDNLTVDNDTYIAIAGLDIKGENLGHWQVVYSVYGGYVGSRQEYEDVKTTQDGFAIGLGARIEKDNFFTALTANFATSFVSGNHAFGDEDFNIYSTSIANKTGADFSFINNKLSIKPSIILGYHYINTQDYKNAAGVNIKAEDLHIFHISPELKFIANLESGYNPYVAASYHWNIENGGQTIANDELLPTLSVDNYAEFAFGLAKTYDDIIHTYAEVILTSGHRTGGGAHIGIKWDF